MNFRNDIKVLFRLNDLPAQTVTWTESKTGKAAFSPAPRPLGGSFPVFESICKDDADSVRPLL